MLPKSASGLRLGHGGRGAVRGCPQIRVTAVRFFLIDRDTTLPLEIRGRLRRGITPSINAIPGIHFSVFLIATVNWYRLRVGAERHGAAV
jgi:hypothetical protein